MAFKKYNPKHFNAQQWLGLGLIFIVAPFAALAGYEYILNTCKPENWADFKCIDKASKSAVWIAALFIASGLMLVLFKKNTPPKR
jgi:hypothetical protein